METITVKVRLDGTSREDVKVGEITGELDDRLMEECRKVEINQKTMQQEETYDTRLLWAKRVCASIQDREVDPKAFLKLYRRDRELLTKAYLKLNELGEAEKSLLVGDSGGAEAREGDSEAPQTS